MKQLNRKNQRARPPPKKVVALFLYPKLKMKRGKEDGIEICCARYGRNLWKDKVCRRRRSFN
ncbi:hypothetical protein CS916_008980 [Enterococcus faecium]|nr:hypothetical protein CS916_008980 [Enterococcus faecium]